MGLDVYCDSKHVYGRSYTGFSWFRKAVADASNIDAYRPWYDSNFQNGPGERASKGWPALGVQLKRHPLRVFMLHSDCEGYIGMNTCRKMLPALKKLTGLIDVQFEEDLKDFISACEHSIKVSKGLQFS